MTNLLVFSSSFFRIPIAFDLLVLKRQWKSFITWSFIALLLLVVRICSYWTNGFLHFSFVEVPQKQEYNNAFCCHV